MNKSATFKTSVSTGNAAGSEAAKSRFSTKMKVIIGTGAAVLVLGGLIIAAMPEPGASNPATSATGSASAAGAPTSTGSPGAAGALNAFVMKYNFGSISMAAGKVTHRYAIRNTGTAPVTIQKMYTSCMCTTAALVKGEKKSAEFGMPGHTPIPTINVPMNPGEEAMVEVIFDPAAHGPAGVGPIERVVTIENSAGRPLELAFAATVRP
ncbi:MAG: DUF1573 domain-containing protein [Acidobacteriota bacterium]